MRRNLPGPRPRAQCDAHARSLKNVSATVMGFLFLAKTCCHTLLFVAALSLLVSLLRELRGVAAFFQPSWGFEHGQRHVVVANFLKPVPEVKRSTVTLRRSTPVTPSAAFATGAWRALSSFLSHLSLVSAPWLLP